MALDTKSFQTQEIVGKPSRFPAGSTLLVNGIHVPHPNAEVNLAGAGDARLGQTKAITETFKDGKLVQEPLHDDVKPRRLTTANDPKVTLEAKDDESQTATPAALDVKVDPKNNVVEGSR